MAKSSLAVLSIHYIFQGPPVIYPQKKKNHQAGQTRRIFCNIIRGHIVKAILEAADKAPMNKAQTLDPDKSLDKAIRHS
jgi:hypothetical protein